MGNHGEDIRICCIKENPAEPNGILNMAGMTKWFPRPLKKGEQIYIPLLKDAFPTKGKHEIELEVENRLGTRYACQIEAEGKEVTMKQIVSL
ncbi:MAG: hypothetical protein NC335_11665 [Bacteroides sp.]|nr:hypothetical protein [Bacteroides sp.]